MAITTVYCLPMDSVLVATSESEIPPSKKCRYKKNAALAVKGLVTIFATFLYYLLSKYGFSPFIGPD